MTSRSIDKWMWRRAQQLLADAERHTYQFFEHVTESGAHAWQAPVDVFQVDGELVIWVALPGVSPETVTVDLTGNCLKVGGARHLVIEPPFATIKCLEIPYGQFERVLVLPKGSYTIVEQDYANGCLRLRMRYE